ncbi:MAG TPA: hypothetical protein VGV41_20360 [Pseudolabrys sp.]|jgi:hypothetical protein|uniref:hypothetical protein n=1 Tax=Pseudolabrys sp. TaxID=1960880 RepID=UPI002DDD8016|nr:hypothetical protein [Pseudolabrys sp.]HEV2630982.1 hypothetical protein [Pseudolabrys sp.]
MIRFLLRFLGLICLAAAFILAIYDGTKSIAASRVFLTSVRTLWELINANSLMQVKPLLTPYAGGMLWDPGMVSILNAPAFTLLACVGIVLLMLGRRKKPLIGYARS